MEQEKKYASLRLDPETKDHVEEWIFEFKRKRGRKLTHDQFVLHALETLSSAGEERQEASTTGRHSEYHAMLDEILDHGSEADIIGIQANLRWGSESVRRASSSGQRAKRRTG